MPHLVHCRVCGEEMDVDQLIKDTEWIMPTKNQYYHKDCYDLWKNVDSNDDTHYKDMIYDFLARDLKVSYSYHLCEAQCKKYIKDGMSYKQIYLALVYYYRVLRNEWDSSKTNGGIGIVPYVVENSKKYWAKLQSQQKIFNAMIEKQLELDGTHKNKIVIKQKGKELVNLDDM